MMQLFRNLILLVAVGAGTVRALLQICSRPAAPAEDANRSKSSAQTKRWLIPIVAFLLLLAFGGFLLTVSGIMPIKASSRHWAVTSWFLNFAMRRSVVTHSLTTETPRLDDPGMVLKGATHYDFGCRPCHGGPELPQPAIAAQMTPHPPHLPPAIRQWRARELFYIVKHGVKFTGMPAWPAQQRDDEVWAMVAFLQRMPALTAQQYFELTRSPKPSNTTIDNLDDPTQTPRLVVDNCSRCHTVDSDAPELNAFPILAGQRPSYLAASLLAFARGERHSGIMTPIARGLSAEDMSAMARYYSSLQPPRLAHRANTAAARLERGEEIATRGIASQRIPACSACHGPGSRSRNPVYPDLAGQYAEYLMLQLELFKAKKRGGTPYAHIMNMIAGRLTTEQMRSVSSYYESLAAGR
jgi:cytochrome c553